jgi:hypothetical protein
VIEKQSSQMKQFEEDVRLLNDPSTPEHKIDAIEKSVETEDKEVRRKFPFLLYIFVRNLPRPQNWD